MYNRIMAHLDDLEARATPSTPTPSPSQSPGSDTD